MTQTQTLSRRERQRAATVEEIKATALRLLVDRGPESVTLRAIAREMGMTAPGLYRYFPSYEELISALVADAYDRLAGVLSVARDAVPLLASGEPDVEAQLVGICRAFRGWSAEHPREFGLMFATPVVGVLAADHDQYAAHLAGQRFGGVFTEVFFSYWGLRQFPVPADDALPPDLVSQLARYRSGLQDLLGPAAAELPLGAIHVFLRCWVMLYGLIAMEVYHHLHFCLDDVGPFFEASLHDMGVLIGMKNPPL
jgi:AcrR family transcriptional regulator